MPELTVYQRSDHRWAWRLSSDDGVIVATNGERGYDDEDACLFMADEIIINGAFRTADRVVQPPS